MSISSSFFSTFIVSLLSDYLYTSVYFDFYMNEDFISFFFFSTLSKISSVLFYSILVKDLISFLSISSSFFSTFNVPFFSDYLYTSVYFDFCMNEDLSSFFFSSSSFFSSILFFSFIPFFFISSFSFGLGIFEFS